VVANWEEFAKFIDRVRTATGALGIRPHQDAFYRGHQDASYRLLPSLFRQAGQTYEQYLKLERRTFFEFRTRARQLYENENTDWDVLFHMQTMVFRPDCSIGLLCSGLRSTSRC
jgi:hypothetical protein